MKKKCKQCQKEFETAKLHPFQEFCKAKCCKKEFYEKNKGYNHEYYLKNKEKIRNANDIWAVNNKNRIKIYGEKWRFENKEKQKEYNKHLKDRMFFMKGKEKLNCDNCQKIIFVYRKRKNNFCNRKCRDNYFVRDKHPNWLGGTSLNGYSLAWSRKFKRMIRERDNYTCQLCRKQKSELTIGLHVHHVDYIKTNCFTFNCITLCISCHALTNVNRHFWIIFFQDYLSEKYGYEYHNTEQKKIINNFN